MCCLLSSIVSYLYVSCSGSISSVGEETYILFVIMWFLLERFPLLLGALGGLRQFIVALPGPSI